MHVVNDWSVLIWLFLCPLHVIDLLFLWKRNIQVDQAIFSLSFPCIFLRVFSIRTVVCFGLYFSYRVRMLEYQLYHTLFHLLILTVALWCSAGHLISLLHCDSARKYKVCVRQMGKCLCVHFNSYFNLLTKQRYEIYTYYSKGCGL